MPRILLSGLLAAGLFCALPASATTGCLLVCRWQRQTPQRPG